MELCLSFVLGIFHLELSHQTLAEKAPNTSKKCKEEWMKYKYFHKVFSAFSFSDSFYNQQKCSTETLETILVLKCNLILMYRMTANKEN